MAGSAADLGLVLPPRQSNPGQLATPAGRKSPVGSGATTERRSSLQFHRQHTNSEVPHLSSYIRQDKATPGTCTTASGPLSLGNFTETAPCTGSPAPTSRVSAGVAGASVTGAAVGMIGTSVGSPVGLVGGLCMPTRACVPVLMHVCVHAYRDLDADDVSAVHHDRNGTGAARHCEVHKVNRRSARQRCHVSDHDTRLICDQEGRKFTWVVLASYGAY